MTSCPDWRCPVVLAVCLLTGSIAAHGQEATLEQLLQAVQVGKLGEAVELARQFDQLPPDETDWTLPLARLARSLDRDGQSDLAVEIYQQAIEASDREPARSIPTPTRIALRLAGGTAMLNASQVPEAVAAVSPVLESWADEATQPQTHLAMTICLHAGGVSLAGGDSMTARQAYALALPFAEANDRAMAMLGEAWSVVAQGEQPAVAATKLSRFCEEYPEHRQASKAAFQSVRCYRAAGDPQSADAETTKLLQSWPDSSDAVDAAQLFAARIHQRVDQGIDLVDRPAESPVDAWLEKKAKSNDVDSFDATLCRLGIWLAATNRLTVGWENLVRRLSELDAGGAVTSKLLDTLPDAESERFAIALISQTLNDDTPSDDTLDDDTVASKGTTPGDQALPNQANPNEANPGETNPGEANPGETTTAKTKADQVSRHEAAAAAIRWAAETGRWSLLVAVVDEYPPSEIESRLSPTSERLFAEAFMQVGRVDASLSWWNHLVDRRGAKEFSILLRCAEAEAAAGSDGQLAQQRIEAARVAAGDADKRIVLTRLLGAQLDVRRTKFEDARTTLESITADTALSASIRQRAQWLTGETYYLQHQFAAAIDAYRKVEGLGEEDLANRQWIAAALVQAGKSFEQLGRTQAAALCYGNLLNRFPDSAHAWLARQRIAVLDRQQRPDGAPDSPETIRR